MSLSILSASRRVLVAVPVAVLWLVGLGASATAQPGTTYHVARRLPVGGEGGWDYLMVDAATGRLFVSHATKAVVIDLATEQVIGEVTPAPGIHGIAIAPGLARGFTSNGRDTSVTVFDLATLAVIGRVKVTGANPDAIWVDGATNRVFTFNGRGQNATAFDAATLQVLGTIPLKAKPEFAQDDAAGTVFVNLEDTHLMAVIDARALRVTKTYDLTGCDEPTGLALDRLARRLISVCGGNKTMIVSDPTAGRVVATLPICEGADAVAYDAATRLAFASCGDGFLTVVQKDSPDVWRVVATVPTARGARTMTLDPRTHRLYLPVAEYGPPAQAGGRPTMVPGSFAILVVEP